MRKSIGLKGGKIMDLSIEELEEWQTVSCNSCARHNYKDSTVNQAMYVDIKMYELSARSQTTVLKQFDNRTTLHFFAEIISYYYGLYSERK